MDILNSQAPHRAPSPLLTAPLREALLQGHRDALRNLYQRLDLLRSRFGYVGTVADATLRDQIARVRTDIAELEDL
ncbi:hypothetical protein [Sandarakinorhabdus sp.]|uniref:hypothetical protein n=1 Tax=Sandarakinorhabdus sp. TaxID=1916663 RepID=UPI0035681EA1